MTIKEFADGWTHFCQCVDFSRSAMDSKAITFMNEMPAAVTKGLTPGRKRVASKRSKVPGPTKRY